MSKLRATPLLLQDLIRSVPHPPTPMYFIFLMYLWSLILRAASSPVFPVICLLQPRPSQMLEDTRCVSKVTTVFFTPSLRRNVLGEEEGWKSLSPPTAPHPEPAGKCSPSAADLDRSEPGLGRGGCLAAAALSRSLPGRATWRGHHGEGGEEDRRLQHSSLPKSTLASLFLGFGQLRGNASSAHASGDARTGTGIWHTTPLGALELGQRELLLRVLRLPNRKSSALLFVCIFVCVREI